jgi:hypothetical protein
MLVAHADNLLCRLSDEHLFLSFHILVFHLLLHDIKHFACRVAVAVHRAKGVYEEFEQQVHVLIIFNNQVDVTVLESQRDALPRVERNIFQLANGQRVEMLPQHPEPRGDCTEHKALDFRDVAAATARLAFEVGVGFERLISPRNLFFLLPAAESIDLCGEKLRHFYIRARLIISIPT